MYKTQPLFGSCSIILFMFFAMDICGSVTIDVHTVNFTSLMPSNENKDLNLVNFPLVSGLNTVE